MEKLKTAIIGAGKAGHMHAAALQTPSSQLTAVWNRTFERAELFAQQYKIRAYHSIEEMIVQGGVQMVTIATTHPTHAQTAIAAMRAGAHVLVDKPLASTLQDCDKMIETAAATGVKLGVISQRRFYPPVQRMRRALDEGKLDIPILGCTTMLGQRDKKYYDSDPWRGSWELEGGGVLVNQAPHQLDILQWMMGPIDEVYGLWANLNHPYIEVDDTAVAVIKFTNGALGNIIVSNSQNPALYGRVHIFGKNGAAVGVQTDGGAMFIAGMSTITQAPYNDLWTIPGEEDQKGIWQKEDESFFNQVNPMKYFHAVQVEDFCQAIINDRQPLVSGQEGRKTVELFTAIYRSTRERKPMKFPLTA